MPIIFPLELILIEVKACHLEQDPSVICVSLKINVFEEDLRKLFKELWTKLLSTGRAIIGGRVQVLIRNDASFEMIDGLALRVFQSEKCAEQVTHPILLYHMDDVLLVSQALPG